MKKILTFLLALGGLVACDKAEPESPPVTPKPTTHYIAKTEEVFHYKVKRDNDTISYSSHTTTTYQYDSLMRVTNIEMRTKSNSSSETKASVHIAYSPNLYTCQYTKSSGITEEIRLHLDEQTGKANKIEYTKVGGFQEEGTDFNFNNQGNLLSFTPGLSFIKEVFFSWEADNLITTQSVGKGRDNDKKLTDKREYTDLKNNIYPDLNPTIYEFGKFVRHLFTKELGIHSTHLVKNVIYDPEKGIPPYLRVISYDYELDELGRPIRITENYKDGTKVIRTITYVEQ